MYQHYIQDMAVQIAAEYNLDPTKVIVTLNKFWENKIAHVWSAEDLKLITPQITDRQAKNILASLLMKWIGASASVGILFSMNSSIETFRF